jgi:SPP1 family phage portal protein
MFSVDKDREVSKELIEEAIDYNEEEKERYDRLERYYKGEHDILKRAKPRTAKNNRVVINHSKYITDINTGYLLGNPVDYKVAEGFNIDRVLEEYNEQTIPDLDVEIAKDLSIFGKQYELVYTVENNVRSTDIDVRNAICVYDDTVAHEKMFGIIYEIKEQDVKTGEREYDRVTVYDSEKEYDCVSGNKLVVGEGEAHTFGKVPLIEYRNNSEEMGDFEQVISLIDAYNILQSDRVNDKEQLVEAILVGYGFNMEDGQMDEVIANKTMFNIPLDGKVEYLVKNLDESQVDILRQNIENDIHKISQTPNMSDENFVGNSSGVAIRYKLLAFEQSVKHKERYFEKGLLERVELYNNYLASINASKEIELYNISLVFKRNLPQNDLETSQMVNNLSHLVDDETLVGQLSFVEDASKSVELNREEEKGKYSFESPQFGTGELTENTEEETEE